MKKSTKGESKMPNPKTPKTMKAAKTTKQKAIAEAVATNAPVAVVEEYSHTEEEQRKIAVLADVVEEALEKYSLETGTKLSAMELGQAFTLIVCRTGVAAYLDTHLIPIGLPTLASTLKKGMVN